MFARIVFAATVLTGFSDAALAHITLETKEAPAGGYYVARFKVGHGCDGSPTKTVKVQIPQGVTNVKPQPKPGWTIEIVKEKLDEPFTDSHGKQITERVAEIHWTEGKLPDAYYDEFTMRVRLPDAPDQTVYFPTVQECEQGIHRWIEIPQEGKSRDDYKEPAPQVKLLPNK